MLGLEIPLKPEYMLLNYWNGDTVPEHNKQTVAILMAVARLEIANNWKGTRILKLENWYNKIWQTFVMYKITKC